MSHIVCTFVPYCAVAAVFLGLGLLIAFVNLPPGSGMIVASLFYGGFLYLLLVAGHILGAFYRKYEHKLNWEV